MNKITGFLKERSGRVLGVASAAVMAFPTFAFAEETGTAVDVTSIMTSSLTAYGDEFAKALLAIVPIGFAIWKGPKLILIVMRTFSRLTGSR